jgi:hypothetical protein
MPVAQQFFDISDLGMRVPFVRDDIGPRDIDYRLCSGRTWLERRWPQHRPAILLSRAGPHRSQGLAFPSPSMVPRRASHAGIDRHVQGGRARDHKELQDARAAATRAASEEAATTRLVGIGESIPLMIGGRLRLRIAAGRRIQPR